MRQNNVVEALVSALVIIVGVGFFAFASISTGNLAFSVYDLAAELPSADGLQVGSDVLINGIRVGTVTGLSLKGYRALVQFNLHNDIHIPDGSTFLISTSGLLDPTAELAIRPGESRHMIRPGTTIVPIGSPGKHSGFVTHQ